MDKRKIIIWTCTIFGFWFIPLAYLIKTMDESVRKNARNGLIVSLIESIIILYLFIDGLILI